MCVLNMEVGGYRGMDINYRDKGLVMGSKGQWIKGHNSKEGL